MKRLTIAADGLARGTAWLVPSAFSIAVMLSLVAASLALLLTPATPAEVLKGWGGGFWELLAFSMQMALVMFSGYLLALTTPVRRLLDLVARAARSPRQAYFGLGATWHAGFSASAPLAVATPKHDFVAQMGVVTIDRTLFSPFLGLTVFVIALLTVFAAVMHPSPERTVRIDPKLLDSFRVFEPPVPPRGRTLASLLDHSRALNLLFGAAALAWLVAHFAGMGVRGLNINVVNFIFLSLAILLHEGSALKPRFWAEETAVSFLARRLAEA